MKQLTLVLNTLGFVFCGTLSAYCFVNGWIVSGTLDALLAIVYLVCLLSLAFKE